MKLNRKQKYMTALLLILFIPILVYQILLSSFAIRVLWLPMISGMTGFQIKAEDCSVSFLGGKTLDFRKAKCVGPGINAATERLVLRMNPFAFLFSDSIEITELKINRLDLEYTMSSQKTEKSAKTSSANTNATNKAEKAFNFFLKSLSISDSVVVFVDSRGNRIRLDRFQFSCSDFQRGGQSLIQWKALLEAKGEWNLAPALWTGEGCAQFPADSFLPESFSGKTSANDFLLSGKNIILPRLSCEFLLDGTRKNAAYRIKKALLKVSGENETVLELSANGEFDPLSPASNRLTLSSSRIDALKIQEIASLFLTKKANDPAPSSVKSATPASSVPSAEKEKPGIPSSAVSSVKEPRSIDLSRFNGSIQFDFKQIDYTPDARLAIRGPVVISGNTVSLDDLKITVNGSPVVLRLRADLGASDGYEYSGSLAMNRLNLPPLLKAFGGGRDSGVTGVVSSLDLQIRGKGVTSAVMKRNLNGTLRAVTSDLSFPVLSANSMKGLNVIMIPLRAIPGVMNSLNKESIPTDWKIFLDKIGSVLNGSQNVVLQTGNIDVAVSGGIVTLKQFQFKGGTLKRETVTGKINLLTDALNLDSEVDAGVFMIPMQIRGTLSKPAPDFRKFLRRFAKDNLKQLLDPDQMDDTVKKVDGLLKLFRKK